MVNFEAFTEGDLKMLLSEDQQSVIYNILNNNDFKNNPAAKVSGILEVLAIDLQRSVIIDFAEHMLEITGKVLGNGSAVCRESFSVVVEYRHGIKNIHDVEVHRAKLWYLEDTLRNEETAYAICQTEVIWGIIGIIAVCCSDELYAHRYIANNIKSSKLKIGANAYQLAKAVGMCLTLEDISSTANCLDKKQISTHRHAESQWQLQHLLTILNLFDKSAG